jgi:hypothetical protein
LTALAFSDPPPGRSRRCKGDRLTTLKGRRDWLEQAWADLEIDDQYGTGR